MPNQNYQRTPGKGKYAYLGIDLKHPPDLMPAGKCPYMLNVSPNQTQGAIGARAGLKKIATVLAGYPVHSVARVNNNIPGAPLTWSRFAGAGDRVYSGQGDPLVMAGAGYDGGNLSFVPLRPPMSPETWLYTYNSKKQAKYRVDGTEQNLGIAPPLRPPVAALTRPGWEWNTTDIHGADFAWSGAGVGRELVDRIPLDTTVAAIVYDQGSTGWCGVVPANSENDYSWMGLGANATFEGGASGNEFVILWQVFHRLASTTIQAVIVDPLENVATIVPSSTVTAPRRDQVVMINGNAVRVLSALEGPENGYSFQVSTLAGTPAVGQTLDFPPCFRCWTDINHAYGEQLQSVFDQFIADGTTPGTALFYNNTTINWDLTQLGGRAVTSEDYLHATLRVNKPWAVAEIHILFDVDPVNTDFRHNYYYYVVRQNDFQAVSSGAETSTQGLLDALAGQIARTYPVEKDQTQFEQSPYPTLQVNQNTIPISEPLDAGTGQWFDVVFKINELTRVGQDESVGLSHVRGVAMLVQLIGGEPALDPHVRVDFGDVVVWGTYGPDCNYNSYGNQGQPILYRYRYRSSLTGAFSEVSPAMRNGILAARTGVLVTVVASSDPQVDLIDIERNGGTFDTWHRCLVVPNVTGNHLDDVRETVAMAGDPLELLHYQPWPVTDQPKSGTCNVIGNRVVWVSGDQFNLNWTRGVEFIVNQQTYTLFASPYTTTLLELAQNVGSATGVTFHIPEATIAGYPLPFACQGPDGRVFATGDPFNPGNLYFSQPYTPDSASDQGYIEVTGPGEPLSAPVFYEGAVYVASNLSLYRVESTPGGANPYTAVKLGIVMGQVMPWAISGTGPAIFYRGPDGVYAFASGGSTNITVDDLYPLLPFESRPGLPVSVAGQALYPPDDTQPQWQHLSFADGMVFYDYLDTQGAFRTLAYTVEAKGWVPYLYMQGVTLHYQEQGALDPLTLAGGADGNLYALDEQLSDDGEAFLCYVLTPADDQGDTRATKQYGDLMMDIGVRAPGVGPATRTVTVQVTDSLGLTSQVTCSITVEPA